MGFESLSIEKLWFDRQSSSSTCSTRMTIHQLHFYFSAHLTESIVTSMIPRLLSNSTVFQDPLRFIIDANNQSSISLHICFPPEESTEMTTSSIEIENQLIFAFSPSKKWSKASFIRLFLICNRSHRNKVCQQCQSNVQEHQCGANNENRSRRILKDGGKNVLPIESMTWNSVEKGQSQRDRSDVSKEMRGVELEKMYESSLTEWIEENSWQTNLEDRSM